MFFIDSPVPFHVQSEVAENGQTIFQDTKVLIRYGLVKSKNEQPTKFNDFELVFGPRLTALDRKLWSFEGDVDLGIARAVSLTFRGALFTEQLKKLSERFGGMDSETRKQHESRPSQATDLFMAFCERSSIELYIPYSYPDDDKQVLNAGLVLELSQGKITPIEQPNDKVNAAE